MDKLNITVKGFEQYREMVGTYEFHVERGVQSSSHVVGFEVLKTHETSYLARPTVGIRTIKGNTIYPFGVGDTIESALNMGLARIQSILTNHYPDILPDHAFVSRTAELLSELRAQEDVFKARLQHTALDWRIDKAKSGTDFFADSGKPAGLFYEFQLEQSDGCFTRWYQDSLYVGITVFDPLVDVFCLQPHDFDKYGTNVFSVQNLALLKSNIAKEIDRLNAINTLSEFIDSTWLFGWIWEPDQPVWRELRDAMVEFLVAVKVMIEQGEREQRALFVLGL